MRKVIERVLSLSREARHNDIDTAVASLSERHRNVETMLTRRFDEACECLPENVVADIDQKLLIGANLSAEYSFEAAALSIPPS